MLAMTILFTVIPNGKECQNPNQSIKNEFFLYNNIFFYFLTLAEFLNYVNIIMFIKINNIR